MHYSIVIAIHFYLAALVRQLDSQSISASGSVCNQVRPVACGNANVLRGQSHIGIPAACFLSVDAGPCSQDLVRIYYDSKTYTCKAFSYSGCGGNANRFVSVKNCYKLCHPYYRQRFVGLAADIIANGNFSANASNTGSSSGTKGSMAQTGGLDMEVVNFAGQNLSDTNVPANAPTFNSTEEPAEVQVVHEFDTYMPPQYGQYPQYPQPYPQPYPQQNYRQFRPRQYQSYGPQSYGQQYPNARNGQPYYGSPYGQQQQYNNY